MMEKVEILSSQSANCVSFAIHEEDHTLGNALRYIIMKNSAVEFCGYSIPHPTEFKIHMRIQTDGSVTAIDALRQGIDDLSSICIEVLDKFDMALDRKDEYELSMEPLTW